MNEVEVGMFFALWLPLAVFVTVLVVGVAAVSLNLRGFWKDGGKAPSRRVGTRRFRLR